MKFSDLSLPITEEEYRNMDCYSYSLLSKYEKVGFNGLDKLYEKIETPSLTFGSVVDTLITSDDFSDKFVVYDIPSLSDTMNKIVNDIIENCNINQTKKIDDETILYFLDKYEYQKNWKNETRLKVFKEKTFDIITFKLNETRTIISNETYLKAIETVIKLRQSPVTNKYFGDFERETEEYYQLKFKTELNGLSYKAMIDKIVIDNNNKTITLIDLKTTGYKEWEFYKPFVEYNYSIQARLYYRIIENIIKNTCYSDYSIKPFLFICINKDSLTPLIWECDFMKAVGELSFGTDKIVRFRDPETIAKELDYYLNEKPKIPKDVNEINNLRKFLEKL